MSVLNPGTILSSRIQTHNIFKVDETRKVEPVHREKIHFSLNTLNNNEYNQVDMINQNHTPKKNYEEFNLDKDNISFDDRILKTNQNFCMVNLNRLLYSRNCAYSYVILIIISIAVLIYSIYGYFAKLNELPIIICELILISLITFDMLIRIFVTGFKNYFSKCLNWLDLILLSLSIITIVLYFGVDTISKELEEISFALLIIVRNSSQLLRLIVLLKNQKEVRRNIEEIIHFGSEFGDKPIELQKEDRKSNAHGILAFMENAKSSKEMNNNKKDMQNFTNLQENYA